ncbi:unnamed protein product, partial [Arabidopsis halleri]
LVKLSSVPDLGSCWWFRNSCRRVKRKVVCGWLWKTAQFRLLEDGVDLVVFRQCWVSDVSYFSSSVGAVASLFGVVVSFGGWTLNFKVLVFAIGRWLRLMQLWLRFGGREEPKSCNSSSRTLVVHGGVFSRLIFHFGSCGLRRKSRALAISGLWRLFEPPAAVNRRVVSICRTGLI